MMYKVIRKIDFDKYKVRGVPVKAELVLAFCLTSGEEIYCANVIRVSSSLHDILHFIRLCKEKNEEFQKINRRKEKSNTI